MKFEELVQQRFSLRKYGKEPVPAEALEKCLEAARVAPSACNSQPWNFVVVGDPERREALAKLTMPPGGVMNGFVRQAPVLVAIVAERPNLSAQIGSVLKNKPFYLIDIGIAAEHFCLQATELGLGTCMIGWFNESGVRKLLDIPRVRRPVLLITLGYPPEETLEEVAARREKRRKTLSEIAGRERYGTPWESERESEREPGRELEPER